MRSLAKKKCKKGLFWTRQYINDLPDSAFAIILPSGEKDEEDKTVPRNLRKFPHHRADGALDLPHLRNANARVPQSDIPDICKRDAMQHLAAHKRQAGIGVTAEEARLLDEQESDSGEVGEDDFEIVPEPALDELIASIEDVAENIYAALEALTRRVEALEGKNQPERVEEAKQCNSPRRAVVAPEALETHETQVDLSKVRLRDVMKNIA